MTSAPEWLDPIGSKDEKNEVGVVHSALFTTYDPPDATLLVEDLLPLCFKMDRESSSDDVENRFFLADLESDSSVDAAISRYLRLQRSSVLKVSIGFGHTSRDTSWERAGQSCSMRS